MSLPMASGLCVECQLPRYPEDMPIERRVRARIRDITAGKTPRPGMCYLCLDDLLMKLRMADPVFVERARVASKWTTMAMAGLYGQRGLS